MPDAIVDRGRSLLLDAPGSTLLALDFDGTLSPIVDDPTTAFAHEHAVEALARLGAVLGQVAIITGRPVAKALELGRFAGRPGLERLVILGQYGAERWDAATGDVQAIDSVPAVAHLVQVLPAWLAERGAGDARIEDKGLAVGVHFRGLDPALVRELDAPLRELAAEHDLAVEPGRQVVELRAGGVDKGDALLSLVTETGARTVAFVGDDLGDLPAFEAVELLRTDGLAGLLVASASAEQDALVSRADLVLDGPDGVAAWLEELAGDL